MDRIRLALTHTHTHTHAHTHAHFHTHATKSCRRWRGLISAKLLSDSYHCSLRNNGSVAITNNDKPTLNTCVNLAVTRKETKHFIVLLAFLRYDDSALLSALSNRRRHVQAWHCTAVIGTFVVTTRLKFIILFADCRRHRSRKYAMDTPNNIAVLVLIVCVLSGRLKPVFKIVAHAYRRAQTHIRTPPKVV